MELDALKTISNSNINVQTYQQAKAAQKDADGTGEAQVKKVSKPTHIESGSAGTGKADRNAAKVNAKTGDYENNANIAEHEDYEPYIAERGSNEILDKAIEQINQKIANFKSEAQYSVHKQTGFISIRVVNSETKELVREIPPVNRLDALAKMWELAGIIVDEKR